MAKISIIVPIYNAAPYLPFCLQSLRMQTLQDLEIILVDDGSNDGSAFLCNQIATKDKRICVLHQTNKGPTAARKAGLRMASAKYVAFLDSDDWLEPDFCISLYSDAEENSAELAISSHFLDCTNGISSIQHTLLDAGFGVFQK